MQLDKPQFIRKAFLNEDWYHGSKKDFAEFDLAYVGTGHGGTNRGWGINLTKYKENAAGYAGAVRGPKYVKSPGCLYTVSFPEDGIYLIWNAGIEAQPPEVMKAYNALPDFKYKTWYPLEEDSTGEIIYMYIRHYFAEKAKKHLVYNDFTNKEASRYLLSHSVIGLKTVTPDFYPEHDRTDTDYDEYVLFSKDYIKIIDKTICRA